MSDKSPESEFGTTGIWKVSTAFAALAAVGLCIWGVVEATHAHSLSRSVQTLQDQLVTTQAKSRSLEAELATAIAQLKTNEQQLVQAAKPDLPISVSFRPALLGCGLVSIFKNHGAVAIEVSAEFTSPTTGAKASTNLILDRSRFKEVGHAEGWAFTAGQRIRLTNNQFRPAEYEVPGT